MASLYFDHASATPLDPRVLDVMLPYFSECFANPSSLYKQGRLARDAVERARFQVASSIGAQPNEIVFTSGGTEANNLALIGGALARESFCRRILTSAVEHQAILQPCRWLQDKGWDVEFLPVAATGVLDPASMRVVQGDIAVCSLMLANNEIGTIQPIAELFRLAKKLGAWTHTDACQALGYIPIDVTDLFADMLTLNSGKIYGPKGCGALYVRKGIELAPLLLGGKQEFGIRAGTENVPAVVGFGAACELALESMKEEVVRLKKLQEYLIEQLLILPGCFLNGDASLRLPNNINVSFQGVESEALLFYLDQAGIMLSSGSACSQGALASHVLLAIGRDAELAQGSIRITFGRQTTPDDIEFLIANVRALLVKLRTL